MGMFRISIRNESLKKQMKVSKNKEKDNKIEMMSIQIIDLKKNNYSTFNLSL